MNTLVNVFAVCNPFRVMSLSRQVRYHYDFVGGGNTIIEEPE